MSPHASDSEDSRQPFGKRFARPDQLPQSPADTEFEQARGLNRVEIRRGYASVRVSGLEPDVAYGRLAVLKAVAEAGASVDFLKLTGSGLSFVIAESESDALRSILASADGQAEVNPGRAVLIAYAVNMRDEEGLVAKIVSRIIASGASIEHMGDMHDRLLVVLDASEAELAKAELERAFLEGA